MNRLILPVATLLVSGCASGVLIGTRPAPVPPPERERGNSESVHVLGVPPGHLPRAGLCRVWVPGVPPGRQERSRPCYGIAATAPVGSWILYRPSSNRNIIHVHEMDRTRVGVLVVVRVFDVQGHYIRDEQSDDHRDDDDDFRDKRDGGRGRNHDRERPRN